MRFTLPAAALALLLAAPAHAQRSDDLVVLRGDVSFELRDARVPEQRGDRSLGPDPTGERPTSAPPGFGLLDEVGTALLRAADAAGLYLHQTRPMEGAHIAVDVTAWWCADPVTWSDCAARVEGMLALSSGDVEPFVVSRQAPSPSALAATVTAGLTEALEALPSYRMVRAAAPPIDSTVVRFGWLERDDGSVLRGEIAQGEDSVCVVDAVGATPVRLEQVVHVEAIDVHLVTPRPGDRYAVARLSDGVVAGTVVDRAHDRAATWVRTRRGITRLPATDGVDVVFGRWNGAPATCGGTRGVMVTRPPVASPPPPEGLVLVDGRGRPTDPGALGLGNELYALDSRALGARRWKQQRLTWEGFADRTNDDAVHMAIEAYLSGLEDRKRRDIGFIVAGLAATVGSAIGLGVVSTAQLVTDPFGGGAPGLSLLGGFAAGGLGTGLTMLVGGQMDLFVVGRKRRGPKRYTNLLQLLDADEVARAAGRARPGGARQEVEPEDADWAR